MIRSKINREKWISVDTLKILLIKLRIAVAISVDLPAHESNSNLMAGHGKLYLFL